MRWLKRIFQAWQRIGLVIGNAIANIFLTIFYFTLFALFAIPFRLLTLAKRQDQSSRFHLPHRQITRLDDLRREF